MSGLGAEELAAVAAIFALAGVVKGAIGLGLPTIGMGLMGAWLPIEQAAAILILPALLTNIWQMLNGTALPGLLRRLWPMMAGLGLGTIAVASLVTTAGSGLAAVVLGAMLIAYALLALKGARFSVAPRAEPVLGPSMGLITGMINGASAIFVIPSAPYLQALELGKDDLVQALGLTAVVSSIALGLALGLNDAIAPWVAIPGTIAVCTAFAGMALGQVARRKISVETFRRWVLVGLLGLGASMIARAIL